MGVINHTLVVDVLNPTEGRLKVLEDNINNVLLLNWRKEYKIF